MRSYEIGVLPESTCFYFSPSAQAQKLFYCQIGCGHFYCNGDYYIKRESYPPLLLAYVCAGTLCLELSGEHYEAGAGQIVLFDCREPHHYYAKDFAEFFYLHFDGPEAHGLCRYLNKSNGVVMSGPRSAEVRRAFESMLQFYERGGNESVFASSARIYQLVSLLDNPVSAPRQQKNDDAIMRAIAYIRSHVGKKITLHELAQLCGLSDYYFSHLFKDITGQSPSEYIIHSRIDESRALLVNTDLSVAEIAHRVGYPNSSNLITLFTQRLGSSPAQFRKTHRTKA